MDGWMDKTDDKWLSKRPGAEPSEMRLWLAGEDESDNSGVERVAVIRSKACQR